MMNRNARFRFHRAETRLAMGLSAVALTVATLTLAAVLPRADFTMAARLLSAPPAATVSTGPVATMQWHETLNTAFEDLARVGVDTLPTRPDEAFALREQPDTGTIATTPPREPRG